MVALHLLSALVLLEFDEGVSACEQREPQLLAFAAATSNS
jgi:hypothetical protein